MAAVDSVAALYVVLTTLALAALSEVFSRASVGYVYVLTPAVRLLHVGAIGGWVFLLTLLTTGRLGARMEEVVAFGLFSAASLSQMIKQGQLLNVFLDWDLIRAVVAAQLLSTWEEHRDYKADLAMADTDRLAALLYTWRVRLVAAPALAPSSLWFRIAHVRRLHAADTHSTVQLLPVLASPHFVRVVRRSHVPERWVFHTGTTYFNPFWVVAYLAGYCVLLVTAAPLAVAFLACLPASTGLVRWAASRRWEAPFAAWAVAQWRDALLYAPEGRAPAFGAWGVWQLGNAVTEERAGRLLAVMAAADTAAAAGTPVQSAAGSRGGPEAKPGGRDAALGGDAAAAEAPPNETPPVGPANDTATRPPHPAALRDGSLPPTTPGVSQEAIDGARDGVMGLAGSDVYRYLSTAVDAGQRARPPSSRELFLTFVLAAIHLEAAAGTSPPSCTMDQAMDGCVQPLRTLYNNHSGTVKKRWAGLFTARREKLATRN